jgi:hypothetical protein
MFEYNETALQLFIDFEQTHDSVWREVLCNILFKFGIPMKLFRVIKMCLNETYSKICIGKNLCIAVPIKNCLKQIDASLQLFFNFALD